jgi:uncharacterized protein (DUF3820 family)
MPWGRFAGSPISELPDDYLYTLCERRLWPNLAAAIDAELTRRTKERRAIRRAA